VVLSPRTNDRSLAMTSSFTNLVLAGLCLARLDEVDGAVEALAQGGEAVLQEHEKTAQQVAASPPARMVALASAPLFGAARGVASRRSDDRRTHRDTGRDLPTASPNEFPAARLP
jgi:tagatose-6-phosphate ketose/aldose isomerase